MDGRGAQKLGHIVEVLAQSFVGGVGRVSNRIVTNGFELSLMCLDKNSLFGSQTILELSNDLLVVTDLFLRLGDGGLEGRLLEDLNLLVAVDFLLFDQFIERFVGILGDDCVDLGKGVLLK